MCERLDCGWKFWYIIQLLGRFTYFPPNQGRRVMEDLRKTTVCEEEQSPEVERVIAFVMKAIEGDVRRIAEALVLKRDDQLFGSGEFDLRRKVLGMASHMLEAAVNDRKKGGIKVPARPVPTVARTPGSSSGVTRHS
jgi:hypothetical protein